MSDKIERDLARFSFKGPGIRKTDSEHYDVMAGEFPNYNVKVDTIQANEQEILEIGREARDGRLVGTRSGRIARAVGSLSDGSGYLVDAQGVPVSSHNQAPVTPMPRRAKEW